MAFRAVIYARCSTEEESQRHALANQVKEARECVRRQGWTLADEYVESQSGTSTRKRREYMRLYENLKSDAFDIIVIKSQDRLMRNTKDWYLFVDRLTVEGKRLYIYLERKFYTPDDALLTGIKAILAEEYSRELSRKINHAHRCRQENNGAVLITSNAYGFRKLPDKSVVLVEEEAEIKRKMYRMCAEGMGSRAIAGKLREEEIVKRSGKAFTKNDILRIIRNPMNKGTVIMNRTHYDFESKKVFRMPEEKQYVYERKIPATVSEQLWQKANDSIDRRAAEKGGKKGRGQNRGKYPLSGKLYCSLCGAPYYRTSRAGSGKRGKIHEWKCRTYQEEGRGGCAGNHLEERQLYCFLGTLYREQTGLEEAHIAGTAMKYIERGIENEKKSRGPDRCRRIEEIKEIKEIKEQMQKLLDKLLEGVVTDMVYEKKQRELEVRLKKAEEKKDVQEAIQQKESVYQERIREIGKRLKEGDYAERALAEQMLEKIEKIVVCPEYLELHLRQGKRDGEEKKVFSFAYGRIFRR